MMMFWVLRLEAKKIRDYPLPTDVPILFKRKTLLDDFPQFQEQNKKL